MKLPLLVLPWFFVACLDPRSGPAGVDATDTHSPVAPPDTIDTTGSVDVDLAETDSIDADLAETDSIDADSTEPGFGIVSNSGPTVVPQTVVRLGAAGASSDATFRWSVDQPVGSVSLFMPSASSEAPTFELNVAGTYVFLLELLDGQGRVTASSSYTMLVVPVSALHVSLTWDTPGDPDQSDTGAEAGSDLDLHFLRTDLGGDWFDSTFDCFWSSPSPSVTVLDPALANHNPTLDRDDTDGAGPENINLGVLSDGTFSIGVHYWFDHGFGNSFATIRVYLHGELIDEWAGVELTDRDLWHSHVFDATTGVLSRVQLDGAPVIQSNYTHPHFPQP